MSAGYNPNGHPDASLEQHLMNIVAAVVSGGKPVVTKLKDVEVRLAPGSSLKTLYAYYQALLEREH